MFTQFLEQGRTMAKTYTSMIPAKDVKNYMDVLVDSNVDFNVALAEAATKYLNNLKGLGLKS